MSHASLAQLPEGVSSVSAPRLFPVAFNLVKSFMSEETQKKIVILGGERCGLLAKPISASAWKAEVVAGGGPISAWLLLSSH
jgi:hypothetical protein